MIDQSTANPVLSQVVQLLNTQDVQKRKRAWEMLIKEEGWQDHKQLVLCFFSDPDKSISEPALKLVCEKASDNYSFYLRQYARHENKELRTLILKTLIKVAEPENIEVFLERIPQEDEALQKELAQALAEFIAKDVQVATESVVKVFAASELASRKAAMSFFLQLPDKSLAIKSFLAFCASIAPMLQREVFAEASAHKGTFSAMLKDFFAQGKDPALLMQAMQLAEFLNYDGLEDELLKALKSSDWLLQQMAIKELSGMKSEKAVDSLLELASDPELGPAAISALDKYGDLKYAKSFFQTLPGASEAVQIELLRVLQNMGDERFLPHFVKFFCSSAIKAKAKKVCYEAISAVCKRSNVAIPKEAVDEKKKMDQALLDELPNLGLKLKV